MIKVLALNDDNHETSYTLENGRRFNSTYEFITQLLAKPHTEDQIISIFDLVANNFKCDLMDFDMAFALLWSSSDERWY